MKKLNTLIYGANGYIGLELVNLLIKHKHISIRYLCGKSSVGKKLSFYDKKFKDKKLPKIIKFNKNLLKNVDLIFCSLPNGDAQKISKHLNKKNILIDLSGDFRLKNSITYSKWYKSKHFAKKLINKSIYSLPEIKKKIELKKYQIISCPGCYPTSILLPLIPLIKNDLVKHKNIIIDSKSGYSGAGRGVHKKYKYKNLYESLSVYGINNHKHNPEIEQELKIETNKNVKFTFTPHISPMFRGILTNIYVDLKAGTNINKIIQCLKKYYKNDYFIKIKNKNQPLSTNDVINSNFCNISVCRSREPNKVIIICAIDNLIKGGAGQAIQNLNKFYNFRYNEGFK